MIANNNNFISDVPRDDTEGIPDRCHLVINYKKVVHSSDLTSRSSTHHDSQASPSVLPHLPQSPLAALPRSPMKWASWGSKGCLTPLCACCFRRRGIPEWSGRQDRWRGTALTHAEPRSGCALDHAGICASRTQIPISFLQ